MSLLNSQQLSVHCNSVPHNDPAPRRITIHCSSATMPHTCIHIHITYTVPLNCEDGRLQGFYVPAMLFPNKSCCSMYQNTSQLNTIYMYIICIICMYILAYKSITISCTLALYNIALLSISRALQRQHNPYLSRGFTEAVRQLSTCGLTYR